jgi:Arginine deiminase
LPLSALRRGEEAYVTKVLANLDMPSIRYRFLDELYDLAIQPIHVWPGEGHAVNSLAVRPGRILISEGAPRTIERLHEAGVETVDGPYSEIRKNGGGIHCSTLPLLRDAE